MDRNNRRTVELRQLAGLSDEDVVLLAGSTQAPEEQYALSIFQRLASTHPQLQLILVPRHKERFEEVASLLDRSGVPWQRRSALPPAMRSIAATSDAPPIDSRYAVSRDPTYRRPRVLLVDAIGELGAWWGTAAVGFVGGSFGARGGQNMLEPAAYGAATCFGPSTRNFRDIVARLLAANGAVVVRDSAELESFVRRALDDAPWATALGARARQLVLAQQGATRKTVELLGSMVAAPGAAAWERAA